MSHLWANINDSCITFCPVHRLLAIWDFSYIAHSCMKRQWKKNACAISDSMTIESFLLRLLFLVCASYKYKTEMKRAVMKHNWWNSNVVIYAMCDGSLINERYPSDAYIVYLAKICGSLILSNFDSDSIWLVTGCDLNWLFNYYPSWSSRLS